MTAFLCPNCGEDAWVADYYEAVHQSITLVVGEDGEPEFGEYTGGTGGYDDGSTSDECWRCQSCDHVIELAKFVTIDESMSGLVLAALLHYGLICYDGRRCIGALRQLGMTAGADALDKALGQRIYKGVGVRDWLAEETREEETA